MNVKEALKKLEGFGTEQNRKIYKRHGVSGEMFGVSYANLGKLAKEKKKTTNLPGNFGKQKSRRAGFGDDGADPKKLSSEKS